MTLFTHETTYGYTDAQLDALNTEWDEIVSSDMLDEGTDEYEARWSEHCDDVSRRPVATRTYSTAGDVRGDCGHKHRTIDAAYACLRDDHAGCASTGGYSGRTRLVVHQGGEIVDATDAETDEWHTGVYC